MQPPQRFIAGIRYPSFSALAKAPDRRRPARRHRPDGQAAQRLPSIDALPLATLFLDAMNRVVTANQAARRLLGWSATPGTGLDPLLKTLSSTAGRVPRALRMLESGVAITQEGRRLWAQYCRIANDQVAAVLTCTPLPEGWQPPQQQPPGDAERRLQALRSVAHDLRAPQHSILAMTELYADDPEAFAACGGIAQVARLARHALALGESFLLATLPPAELAARNEHYDLAGVATDVIRHLALPAGQRGVRLQLAGQGQVPMYGPPVCVARALQNLLDNAVQASPSGTLVTVSLSRAGSRVRIEIADQAGGLPGYRGRQRLTGFARVATKARSRGFGLGLNIVEQMATLLGGQLEAETEEGVGTRFLLDLPCTAPGAATALPTAEALTA